MIYVTGDMHGEFSRFKNKNIKKQLEENDTLIICGDFGFIWEDSRHERSIIEKIGELNYNVAFVDGCHENFDLLQQFEVIEWNGGKAHHISGNLVHLMRGQVYTIEDKKIFAFGGGHSQDYEYRKNINWWPQEHPTHEEIIESINNLGKYDNCIDYIITHEPPASLKDCLEVDVFQRLEIHAFFEDIIKACHFDYSVPAGKSPDFLFFHYSILLTKPKVPLQFPKNSGCDHWSHSLLGKGLTEL